VTTLSERDNEFSRWQREGATQEKAILDARSTSTDADANEKLVTFNALTLPKAYAFSREGLIHCVVFVSAVDSHATQHDKAMGALRKFILHELDVIWTFAPETQDAAIIKDRTGSFCQEDWCKIIPHRVRI